MNSKNDKGITLIALVITIIVLLILAGVTISMVLGADGIIAQAQHAKQAQKAAEDKEKEDLKNLAEDINLYKPETDKPETLVSNVNVGDYVKYTYTAPAEGYTTPAAGTGKEVYSKQKTFKSAAGENEAITEWRVLSKKDGIIKLVAAQPISSLTLEGAKGWVNGPDVLNEMCETLYSSSIGTARSINVDDVNEITKYEPPKSVKIADLEAKYGNLENRSTPDGRNISTYESNDYNYKAVFGDSMGRPKDIDDNIGLQMLFTGASIDVYSSAYWLANTCVLGDGGSSGVVGFRVFCVGKTGQVSGVNLFNSDDIPSPATSCGIRPVVTLKSGIEIGNGDGRTAATAWEIK